MNKQSRLTRPYIINIRLASPLGLLGVPPDMTAAVELLTVAGGRGGGKYG